MFCLNKLITTTISYWQDTMTHQRVCPGPFQTSRQNRNGLWNIWTEKLYGDSFRFEEIYLQGKLFTFIRPLHLMRLCLWKEWFHNKWLTRKTHPCLFSWFCPVFTQDKFCPRRLWRFPVWDKICKVETNHPNLLSVGDDRKFVLIKSFFANADRP